MAVDAFTDIAEGSKIPADDGICCCNSPWVSIWYTCHSEGTKGLSFLSSQVQPCSVSPGPQVQSPPTATPDISIPLIVINQDLTDSVVSTHVHSLQAAAVRTEEDEGQSGSEAEDSSCEGSGLRVEEMIQAARHVTRQVCLSFWGTACTGWLMNL